MNIKFESSFLMRNFNALANTLNKDVKKEYPVTKEDEGKVALKENEVLVFKIYKSKFERDYKIKFNKKYEHLKENDIVREISKSSSFVDCDIYVTNKYMHLIFAKGKESISLNNIIEAYITPKYLTIYTIDKKYNLFLNNITYIMQTVFIVDVLKNITIGDEMVGKTMNIEINK